MSEPDLGVPGLRLRRWAETDAEAVLALALDVEGGQWSRSLRQVHDLAGARQWLCGREGPGRMEWASVDTATGEVLGRVHLFEVDQQSRITEIGYAVWPGHRRRGLATAMVFATTRFAFLDQGYRRVMLVHALGNTASCAVATRCGFAFEGVERAALDHGDGIAHDAHRHARLADDPPGPADPAPEPLDVPVVQTDGLVLRPWQPEDAAVYLRGLTDPAAARWRPGPPPVTEDDARRLIARLHRRSREGHTVAWAVEEDGLVVGSVGLRGVNLVDRWVSAAYWVLPEARGHGVAPRALSAATAYAFDRLGLHRVQLQHALGNAASCRVAEKAGFRLEGLLRESCRLAEGFVDEHQHVRIRSR